MSDFRDIVIEMLADSEAELREQAIQYRMLATEAIHLLHRQQQRIEAQQRTISYLRDEIRRYTRAQVLGTAEAA